MDFAFRLAGWYEQNKRELPWRNTKNPYFIWLSEIILQQTRVDQGLSYYIKFTEKYPDVFSLANAPRDEVFKLWQGLGYYNRADNMLLTAKLVAGKYDGNFPENRDLLLQLPGIGPYTSAAIASIAFGVPVPVVDGNVYRVLARLFGVDAPVNSAKGSRLVYQLAEDLLDKNDPGTFNQAVMEFGALKCTPANPECADCLFNTTCYARLNGTVNKLPVKKPKTTLLNRYFYYFHIRLPNEGSYDMYLNKRTGGDIWKNLYDFVLTELPQKTEVNDEFIMNNLKKKINMKHVVVDGISKEYKQRLSHQLIHAVFIKIIVHKKVKFAHENSLILVPEKHLIDYPVPRLIERYVTDEKIIK